MEGLRLDGGESAFAGCLPAPFAFNVTGQHATAHADAKISARLSTENATVSCYFTHLRALIGRCAQSTGRFMTPLVFRRQGTKSITPRSQALGNEAKITAWIHTDDALLSWILNNACQSRRWRHQHKPRWLDVTVRKESAAFHLGVRCRRW